VAGGATSSRASGWCSSAGSRTACTATRTGGARWPGYTVVVAFAASYLLALGATWPLRRVRFLVGYLAMLAFFAVEPVFAHERALVMLIYVAVLTTVLMRWFTIPVIAALALVAAFVPALVPAWHAGVQVDWLITIPLVAIAMWGFFGLIRSNNELAAARAEVARLAAENERTRIARDLHDLLGHSLSTITVKAGLARRLAERGEPERAAAEIAAVERLSRATLADVRAAVAGQREITLAAELATAREVLRAAGILAELPGSVDIVDPALSELFGWALREGITNVGTALPRHALRGHLRPGVDRDRRRRARRPDRPAVGYRPGRVAGTGGGRRGYRRRPAAGPRLAAAGTGTGHMIRLLLAAPGDGGRCGGVRRQGRAGRAVGRRGTPGAPGERVVDPSLAAATLAGGPSPLTGRERDVLVAARNGRRSPRSPATCSCRRAPCATTCPPRSRRRRRATGSRRYGWPTNRPGCN